MIQDTHTHAATYGQGHVELGSSFPKVRVGCVLWWKSFTDWIAWCNLEMVKTAEAPGWHRARGLRPVQNVCVCLFLCLCVYEWERKTDDREWERTGMCARTWSTIVCVYAIRLRKNPKTLWVPTADNTINLIINAPTLLLTNLCRYHANHENLEWSSVGMCLWLKSEHYP